MLVNMGPQHPSTHGVLRIVLRTDGEMVLEAVPHLGYLHRCKEKIAENLAYYQYIGYTDRLDYLAAMNNNHAWSMAVEKLAGVEVPLRAEYIRVIAVELNRIASHLVSFGTYGWTWARSRRSSTPSASASTPRPLRAALRRTPHVSYINSAASRGTCRRRSSKSSASSLTTWSRRSTSTTTCSVLTHFRQAHGQRRRVLEGTSASAPPCRADDPRQRPPLDLRRDRPYSIYTRLEFDVVVGEGLKGALGDCWDRYWVKMQEMKQCVRILRQCIAQMPDGAFRAKLPRSMKVPPGEVYEEYENPRGHLGVYIESQGGVIPYRVKIRGPSFVNLAVTQELCRNVLLADVPAIVGSIDIVMGEVDR